MDRRSLLKAASLGLASPVAASALSGCSRPDREGVVRFEGWDYEAALVQRNVNRFHRLNRDVRVEYTPITSAQFIQKITAEFMGGGGPDVLYMYDDSLAASVEAEYLQPLDGIDGVADIYDAIYPSVAAAMTYRGRRYGLPYYTDAQTLVYNARILDRAGIAAPPRTLDELEDQALRIKRLGLLRHPIGLAAQLSDTAMMWFWGLVFANEDDLFDERLRPIMSRSGSAATSVLEWLRRATHHSQVLDPACVQTLPVPLDNAMMAGQYAFGLVPRYSLRSYNDPAESKTAGAMRMTFVPSLDGRTEGTASNARMYCLSRTTEVRRKSIRLLKYLGGFDGRGVPYTAKFWFLQRGLGFAFRGLAEDPDVSRTLSSFAEPTMYLRLAEVARRRGVLDALWYAEFEAAMQRAVQRVLTGASSPADASADLDRTARSLARRYA